MVIRPLIRPGCQLMRRGTHHLQVGTNPGVVFPDQPGLVSVLRLMDGVRTLDRLAELTRDEFHGDLASVVRELISQGALISGIPRRRRPSLRVALVGHDLGADFRRVVASLLYGHVLIDHAEPDITITDCAGEADRAVFDALHQVGAAYLPVTFDGPQVRVGPLATPGKSPCLFCYDAWRTDWDSAWPFLLSQCSSTRVGDLGTAAPIQHATAAFVASNILSLDAAQTPDLVGHVVHFDHELQPKSWHTIGFHHRCGCTLLPGC